MSLRAGALGLRAQSTATPIHFSKKLPKLREDTLLGGGKDAIRKQHERGKLTARERIELLLDAGSFR